MAVSSTNLENIPMTEGNGMLTSRSSCGAIFIAATLRSIVTASMNISLMEIVSFWTERIRLLYCNKVKWGDQPNHYDLMHPIDNAVKKVKKFVMEDRMEMNQQQTGCEGDYE
eukprot:15853898-Heterocapsa_arctica.AAC.1